MTIARQPSAVALILADEIARHGARWDDEAGCIIALRGAGWHPSIIHDHLDEAREHAAAGRGVQQLRRAA